MNYSFIPVSGNSKTGPMPVTMTEKVSCPNSCPLKGNGCYAATGRSNIHWTRLGAKGINLRELTEKINFLIPGKLWRHNVAGDFSLDGSDRLDNKALVAITKANRGRKGFCYTHVKPGNGTNKNLIKWANSQGFTVNLSADSLKEADELSALNIAPIVTILPEKQTENLTTPGGRKVVICPNYKDKRVQCIDCQLCQKSNRTCIVGFPAHGIAHKRVTAVFNS